jgi:hypothetical protein
MPPDDSFAQLADALRRWLNETRAAKPVDAPTAVIDPELERTLRSLGYLGDDEE